jgi:diacylglycerol kinase family enzyme
VFGGGMRLVPDAQVDDGLLDVVLTADASRAHMLAGLRKVFKGTHVTDPLLTFLRGREIAFEADRPFTAFADGDPIAALPARIGIAPRSLKVLAP